jgi:hypothetical protein
MANDNNRARNKPRLLELMQPPPSVIARRLQALCRTQRPAIARIWGGKRTRVVPTIRDVLGGGACDGTAKNERTDGTSEAGYGRAISKPCA